MRVFIFSQREALDEALPVSNAGFDGKITFYGRAQQGLQSILPERHGDLQVTENRGL